MTISISIKIKKKLAILLPQVFVLSELFYLKCFIKNKLYKYNIIKFNEFCSVSYNSELIFNLISLLVC